MSRMLSTSLLLFSLFVQRCFAFSPLSTSYNYGQRLRMSINDEPVTDKMQAMSTAKKIGAAVGVLGLFLGKKSIDGPGEYE